jgi:hypothetical protein
MSASLPKGTSITADESKNDMAIQLIITVFIDRSLLMLGKAMFTAELMNGLKKEERKITAKRIRLLK